MHTYFDGRIIDYHLKGCMEERFWTITLSGSTKRNFPFEIFRSRLIGKFGAYTYKE